MYGKKKKKTVPIDLAISFLELYTIEIKVYF